MLVPLLLIEIGIVIVLTVVNGLLAMSELAVVSSRPARLKALKAEGSYGAGVAATLAENPGRFLSTVQIGITLVGVLSGAFSGATLGARLAAWFENQGMSDGLADALGVGLVVMAITYVSLIVGELVPKQIALRDPERVAARVAPAMAVLARFSLPLVWLLDGSGRLILRILGQQGQNEERVTEEEVKTIIAEAESAGVLESAERDMIGGVMRLADRSARALMTPRREVEVIDLSDTPEEIRAQVRATRRTRLPVQDGEADAIIGVVNTKDLFDALADGNGSGIKSLTQEVPIVLDTSGALHVLRVMRSSRMHMVLVFDEFGHFEGIISSGDVLEAITGEFHDDETGEPACVVREDGSFLVAGWMPIDEFNERIGFPIDRDPGYETVAGLVLATLNRLPSVGECFDKGPWRFEVLDLDGRRVDKVLVSRREPS